MWMRVLSSGSACRWPYLKRSLAFVVISYTQSRLYNRHKAIPFTDRVGAVCSPLVFSRGRTFLWSINWEERREGGYRVAHHCCCGGTADIKYRQCTTTISFAKKVYIAKDKWPSRKEEAPLEWWWSLWTCYIAMKRETWPAEFQLVSPFLSWNINNVRS
jgi:hypothetical protein